MTQQSSELVGKSPETVSDVDASLLKIIALMALTTLSAGMVGYFLVNPNIVVGLSAIGVFLALFIFQVLLVKSWNKIFLGVLAQSVTMALPAVIDIGRLPPYVVTAWAIFLFTAVSAEFSGIQKIKDSIIIPFWKVSRIVFTRMFVAICLFAAIIYIFVPAPPGSRLASASGAAGEIAVVRPIKYFIPEFSSATTVGQLLRMLAERSVNAQKFAQSLSASEKGKLIRETANGLESLIEEKIGPINFNLTIGSAIIKTIANYMVNLGFFSFLLANVVILASLSLLFRGVSLLLYFPVSIVVFLIYETLIVTNFISVQYESRSREIAILK